MILLQKPYKNYFLIYYNNKYEVINNYNENIVTIT